MENIVGKKGYKKSGFFEGLVGVIEQCNTEGFEHLYRLVFDNGGSVVASENDIEVVHEIILTDWEYTCSDGCCYEYGTELIIDSYIITRNFDMDTELFKEILNAFEIKFVLKFESEN